MDRSNAGTTEDARAATRERSRGGAIVVAIVEARGKATLGRLNCFSSSAGRICVADATRISHRCSQRRNRERIDKETKRTCFNAPSTPLATSCLTACCTTGPTAGPTCCLICSLTAVSTSFVVSFLTDPSASLRSASSLAVWAAAVWARSSSIWWTAQCERERFVSTAKRGGKKGRKKRTVLLQFPPNDPPNLTLEPRLNPPDLPQNRLHIPPYGSSSSWRQAQPSRRRRAPRRRAEAGGSCWGRGEGRGWRSGENG